ncbi:hypothetical protein ACFQZC_02315 [Streptacidiphilus monticola]
MPQPFAHTTAEGTAQERRASWQRAYCRAFVDVRVSLRDPATWAATLQGSASGSCRSPSRRATALRPSSVSPPPRRTAPACCCVDNSPGRPC